MEQYIFPGWKVIRTLGTGSYGKVYEVETSTDGRTERSAVKVVSVPASVQEAEDLYSEGIVTNREELSEYISHYIESLTKEVDAMMYLRSSRNVVQYGTHRIVMHQGWPGADILIKMELLQPLDKYMRSHEMTVNDIIRLGTDMCRALEDCHGMNPPILHRDIKPANIMADADGVFKLGDFGVAKFMEGTRSEHTRIGTEDYMAPEVITQRTGYGKTADIYSLGMVLYRLLNNQRIPFVPAEGSVSPEQRSRARQARVSGERIPEPVHGTAELKRAVMKAISYEPGDRYQTASEFRLALEKCIRGGIPAPQADNREGTYAVRPVPEQASGSRRPPESDDWQGYPKREKIKPGLIAVLAVLVALAVAALVLYLSVIRPAADYNHAKDLYAQERYEEAVQAFTALNGYSDSAEQIKQCETAIKDREYEAAKALYEAGDYEGAKAAFTALNGYNDSAEQIKQCETAINEREYAKAAELEEKGDIAAAYDIYVALGAYSDSIANAERLYSVIRLKAAAVGDEVVFGSYEQDNDTANGREEIEWLVLEKKDNKVLLISKYALDCLMYNTAYEKITWEKCTLRTWLNGTFIDAAFSEREQAMIANIHVTADKNPKYSTNPGNSTQDKVFLLSITEAEKYFSSDNARQCKPTAYAVANGAYVNRGSGNCWWWLRSPGYDQNCAAGVYYGGSVYYFGNAMSYGHGCIRPALWINLES